MALAASSSQEQAAKIAAHAAAEIDKLTAALESGDKATAERAVAQLRGPVQVVFFSSSFYSSLPPILTLQQEQLMFNKALAELSGDPNVIASTNKAATFAPQLVTAAYPFFLISTHMVLFFALHWKVNIIKFLL